MDSRKWAPRQTEAGSGAEAEVGERAGCCLHGFM